MKIPPQIKENNSWNLVPAYDLAYLLNINLTFSNVTRALSINNKRNNITLEDILSIAEAYVIKNPKGMIKKVQQAIKNGKKLQKNWKSL